MAVDYLTLSAVFERVVTRRLALRPVTPSDAWPLFGATRNPLFNRDLLWSQPQTVREVVDRIDAIVDASRRGRLCALSAVVRETGEWVSLYRFQPHASMTDAVEMGIWTVDKFWHGRYSLELVRACIDAAFDEFEIDTLVGAAALANRSSCKLMEMSGMTARRMVVRRHEAGDKVELQEFNVTRKEWMRERKRAAFEYVPTASELVQARVAVGRDQLVSNGSFERGDVAGGVASRGADVVVPGLAQTHGHVAVHATPG